MYRNVTYKTELRYLLRIYHENNNGKTDQDEIALVTSV